MSFIELPGLADVKEKYAAAEGLYDLCITSAKVTEKEGKHNIQTILTIEGPGDVSTYANVFHYLSLPGGDDDADKKATKLLFLARFLGQFGIDASSGLETEQMVGSRASACKLTQEEYPEGSGLTNNKFSPNQLPKEEA